MRELARLVVVVLFWFAVSVTIAAACTGCATVQKAAPYALRAGACCAECAVKEWKAFKAAPAELAPSP